MLTDLNRLKFSLLYNLSISELLNRFHGSKKGILGVLVLSRIMLGLLIRKTANAKTVSRDAGNFYKLVPDVFTDGRGIVNQFFLK